MNVMERGTLIHVPSETLMVDCPTNSSAKSSISLKAPKVFLVVDNYKGMCKILYNGKSWYVPEKNVYKVGV